MMSNWENVFMLGVLFIAFGIILIVSIVSIPLLIWMIENPLYVGIDMLLIGLSIVAIAYYFEFVRGSKQ